jgi:hypothetical protein
MLAAWILGSLFFVFIIGFILYVLRTDVSWPEPSTRPAGAPPAEPTVDSGKCLISRDYQIVFSSRVFVNYPFGVRMVFARLGTAEPVAAPGSNHRPAFQESEYYGWSRPVVEDPELTVVSGHIEFEAKGTAPTIRVELKPAGESFQAIATVAEQALRPDGDVVFSFWLNPLEPRVGSLKVVVSHIPGAPASDGKAGHELAAIPLTVSAVSFPIALR